MSALLKRSHSSDQGGRGTLTLRQANENVELGFLAKVDGTAAGEVFLGQVTDDAAPAWQGGDDLVPHL